MLPAVDFDDQPRFVADEIGNVAAKGYLAAEFPAVHLPEAQDLPEASFGVGHASTQRALTAMCTG